MKKSTYLFYDIETTGLNKCFDQVLQFAAIRTDHQFNEIARDEICVRLNPDVIPAPGAVITHRIGVDAFSQGMSEWEAIQKIHTLLNTPNTISVGYNSLGFDDEFLRFSFYKNLLPPYTHQYANGCGRLDIYPIVLLYYLFKTDHLIWPHHNNTVSLKLENINACNHFFQGQSHNAMVDVEVTLALAKKLSEDKKMWDFVTDYFHKKSDEKRIAQCLSTLKIGQKVFSTGLMVNGKIGNASQFIAPVMNIGQHQHYKNQSLWLRLDQENLIHTTKNNIAENTFVFRKRLAEPPIFLPEKERYFNLMSDDRKKCVEKNKQWLRENPSICDALCDYHQHEKYPEVPERDIDAGLYDSGFPSASEENAYRQFHLAKPDKKLSMIAQFPNTSRQAQAIRILGRHFPNALSEDYQQEFNAYLNTIYSDDHQPPIDFKGAKKLTRSAALADIEKLQQSKPLDPQQHLLLRELKCFLEKKMA